MAKQLPLDEILEADWQKMVLDLAKLMGWRIAHFRPALTTKGWRTPVAADGAGFPDLFLVRDRLLAVELKREKSKPTVEQIEWIRALINAQVEVYVARPRHLEDLATVLRARGTAPATTMLFETHELVTL